MGWTFLYAGLSQVLDPHFTAAGFLGHTKTFHDVFAVFAAPAVAPVTDFLVQWGHLLIGLSLVTGLMVRVSGVFGILLLSTYYFAHMDWPYVDSPVNFIMEYHLVYIAALVFVIAGRGGEVFGLDGWLKQARFVQERPILKPLLG
jgi:thiosulfate dehydrogenase [quinone] large subunit